MNWMDILVLLIIGGEVFRAFRQGMVKTVIELAAWIVALIAGKLYYKVVAAQLVDRFEVFQNLEQNIYAGLTKNFTSQAQLQAAASSGQIGGKFNLPDVLNQLPKDVVGKTQDTMNQLVFGDLAHKISEMMINGLSFMLIVFGVMAALAILTVVLDQMAHLPLIKEVNKLGGLLVGIIKGGFSVLVLMTIITFVVPFLKSTWLIDAIQNSQVAIYFYNNNILLYLIYYLLR